MVEDLHLGDDASGVDDEVAQELEFGGGQVDGHARARDFVGVLVDDEVSDAQECVVFFGAHGAAQDGADAGDDLFEAEGLGDVVVAADGQALDLVAHVVARGEEEDGDRDAGVAQAPGDGEAVHVGEHDVEDDEVGARGLGFVECAAAVLGGDDVEAGKTQRGGEEVSDVGFVVDDEEFCFSSRGAHATSVAYVSECFL